MEDYGKEWNLLLLRDGQALYVDGRGHKAHLTQIAPIEYTLSERF